MSLAQIGSIDPTTFDIISVDVFDTILLRDQSVQRARFAEVAIATSRRLKQSGYDVSPETLLCLRQRVHRSAYQAVSVERLSSDATLRRMIEAQMMLLGLEKSVASFFLTAELEVESRHLSPNLQLLRLLSNFRRLGKRVIAVSDTYFSVASLQYLLEQVVGESPIERIYSSSDLGRTKHFGNIFPEVARLEAVGLSRILHCGDDRRADFEMPRAAGCRAVLLPRPFWIHAMRRLSASRWMFETLSKG